MGCLLLWSSVRPGSHWCACPRTPPVHGGRTGVACALSMGLTTIASATGAPTYLTGSASAVAARRLVIPEAARLAEPALELRRSGRRRRRRRGPAAREGVIGRD